MSCGGVRIRVRILVWLERRGGCPHVLANTRTYLVRRLGGHYSATRAPLAEWLQRDELRADLGI